MHLLSTTGLTRSFPGVRALSDLDFTLASGEIHALMGENGAGKSTFIKLVTGVLQPDGGTITLGGAPIAPRSPAEALALGIGTVYQEVNLLPNLTVAENLFLGREHRRFGLIDFRSMARRAAEIATHYGLEVDVQAPLGSCSVAVQQLIAIARAVDFSAKVLILDEPTASLDAGEVAKLFKVMRDLRAQGIGILFVSHFLDQIYEISDRITVLRNGRLVGTAPTATLKRPELIAMMLGRDLAEATHHHVPVAATDAPEAVAFHGIGRRGSVAPFDLVIRKGEVVGVAGLLGSGRTETARLLFGVDRATAGSAQVAGRSAAVTTPRRAIRLGFAYCPEERKTDGIVGDLSVRENIILALQARRGWLRPLSRTRQDRIARDFIAQLDIRTPSAETPIRLLSGGNQQKALLARWLATQPSFLILDESTRGIDVGAHAEIVRLIEGLCAAGLALLVISSELEEIVAYSDRVRILRDRKHVAELAGPAITIANIVAAIAQDAPASGSPT